jgi:hypothetical protein
MLDMSETSFFCVGLLMDIITFSKDQGNQTVCLVLLEKVETKPINLCLPFKCGLLPRWTLKDFQTKKEIKQN